MDLNKADIDGDFCKEIKNILKMDYKEFAATLLVSEATIRRWENKACDIPNPQQEILWLLWRIAREYDDPTVLGKEIKRAYIKSSYVGALFCIASKGKFEI